jgi:hypothetical protein
MSQRVTSLSQPIIAETPGTPLVVRITTLSSMGEMEGGPGQVRQATHSYININLLPDGLREQVRTAVELLLQV